MHVSQYLEQFSHGFAKWAGSAKGFLAAVLSLFIWLIIGKYYAYSTGWENGLTIYIGCVTFLMIFLMQRAQNKELAVLHVKLNELIAATRNADNRLINIDELTEKEIGKVQETHRKIGDGANN